MTAVTTLFGMADMLKIVREIKYLPMSTRRIQKIIMNIIQILNIQIVWKMEAIYCVSVFQITI